MNIYESAENYLEAILRIRSERGSCHNVDIACLLGYSKANVTKALAGLSTEEADLEDIFLQLTRRGAASA